MEPGNGSVKINWNKPDDTGGTKLNEYIITLMPNQDPFPVPYNKEDSQSYTLNDLKNNSEYSVKIISVNEFGTSDPVLSESFIPFDDPVPPSKIYVEAVAGGIDLSWELPRNDFDEIIKIEYFNIRDRDGNLIKENIPGNETFASLKNLEKDKSYQFTIISIISNTKACHLNIQILQFLHLHLALQIM